MSFLCRRNDDAALTGGDKPDPAASLTVIQTNLPMWSKASFSGVMNNDLVIFSEYYPGNNSAELNLNTMQLTGRTFSYTGSEWIGGATSTDGSKFYQIPSWSNTAFGIIDGSGSSLVRTTGIASGHSSARNSGVIVVGDTLYAVASTITDIAIRRLYLDAGVWTAQSIVLTGGGMIFYGVSTGDSGRCNVIDPTMNCINFAGHTTRNVCRLDLATNTATRYDNILPVTAEITAQTAYQGKLYVPTTTSSNFLYIIDMTTTPPTLTDQISIPITVTSNVRRRVSFMRENKLYITHSNGEITASASSKDFTHVDVFDIQNKTWDKLDIPVDDRASSPCGYFTWKGAAYIVSEFGSKLYRIG